MNKKIVRYSALHSPVNEGSRVLLIPVDHPDRELVTNGKEVITSPVETVGYDGLFTTRNTIYVPEGYVAE